MHVQRPCLFRGSPRRCWIPVANGLGAKAIDAPSLRNETPWTSAQWAVVLSAGFWSIRKTEFPSLGDVVSIACKPIVIHKLDLRAWLFLMTSLHRSFVDLAMEVVKRE